MRKWVSDWELSGSERDVAAFVLAGGLSSRMGADKALLVWDGAPLIEHALNKLRRLDAGARIVGSRPDLERFGSVIEDGRPRCGPLGGIETALAASGAELNVFVPVDLPLMPAVFLEWMVARAAVTGAATTIPMLGGRAQPLCSMLRRSVLSDIGAALDEGNYKVMAALTRSGEADFFNVETVSPAQREWPVDPPLHLWFQNLNRPEDLYALAAYQNVSQRA